MSTRDENWKPSTEDMDFLAKLNQDLGELDFYYQYSSDSSVYNREETKKQAILDKIKTIEDSNVQDVAIILYDLHVSKHDGALGVDWDSFLKN
tara:strand:+ start:10033 stop:10311 length:279 start_codon:yes stop_codon:yes gene_type:complete